ncbi:MAG: type II CAAX endopeptidase family protein [Pseudomonadota bacterium]
MFSKYTEERTFATILSFGCVIIGVAYILSLLLEVPLAPQLLDMGPPYSIAIVYGIAVTIPMVVLLKAFMNSTYPPFLRFREDQIEFISRLGFKLTSSRILLISLVAGIGEELLFRGVFQTYLSNQGPLLLSIIIPNILFGLLHARTIAYALIAGAAGCYFGIVFVLTGSLIVPILAHALYDFVALAIARREIEQRQVKV